MIAMINPDTVGVILADVEILDIIIALIIIYSILSPLLSGKKKKSGKQKKSPTSASDQNAGNPNFQTKEEKKVSSSGDIFEEIGNILREERGNFQSPERTKDNAYHGEKYQPETRKDYRGYYEQNEYEKQMIERQNEIMQRYDQSVFTSKENVITVPETISEERTPPPPIKKRLLSGLKDPETVREYIIANELLRKPKFPRRFP